MVLFIFYIFYGFCVPLSSLSRLGCVRLFGTAERLYAWRVVPRRVFWILVFVEVCATGDACQI